MEGATTTSLPLRGLWRCCRIQCSQPVSQLRLLSWTRHRHHLPKPDRDQRSNRDRPSAFSSHDSHLSSILDHPLFRVIPSRPPSSVTAAVPTVSKTKGPGISVQSESRNFNNDSLALLDELIARGQADHTLLHRCLQRHVTSSRSQSSSRLPGVNGLHHISPEIIDKVIAWYNSTPWDARRCFFDSRNTLSFITSLLVHSQKQEVAMAWLLDLHESSSLPCWLSKSTITQVGEVRLPTNDTCVSNVMDELIAAQLKYTRNIHAALEYFLRICDLICHHQKAKGDGKNDNLLPARRTISTLAGWIANNFQTDEVKQLSSQIFEVFLRLIKPRVGSNSSYLTALISLFHPTNPDPTPAILYTKQKFGEIHSSTSKSSAAITMSTRNRQKLLRLSLEAASLCLQEKRFGDAQWFLSCARESLGLIEDDQLHQRTALEEPAAHHPFSIERLGGIISH